MKLLKYILLFIFSLLLNRNVSATNVNHPNALHKKGDAVKALALAKDNVNMANFGITTQTLANMRGNPAASYSQVCNKVNLLVDELPTNVSNLDKYLGAQGFSKTQTMYTKRHSWVQLERLLENKEKLNIADKIVFEREIQNIVNGTNYTSVTDVYMKIGLNIYEIETKAGIWFFENISNTTASSNFAKQSFNSLTNVNKLENYKVFLNPEILSQLDNASTFAIKKNNVINAWKNWEGGMLFDDTRTLNLFTDFVKRKTGNTTFPTFTSQTLESYLINNDDWFEIIFKTNLIP